VKFKICVKFPLQYKLQFIASASQEWLTHKTQTMTYFTVKLENNEKENDIDILITSQTL